MPDSLKTTSNTIRRDLRFRLITARAAVLGIATLKSTRTAIAAGAVIAIFSLRSRISVSLFVRRIQAEGIQDALTLRGFGGWMMPNSWKRTALKERTPRNMHGKHTAAADNAHFPEKLPFVS